MPKGKDVIGLAKDKQAVMADLKFMDFLGLWQHFTIPIAELSEAVFEEGGDDEEAPLTPGADGSLGIGSLKGMQR